MTGKKEKYLSWDSYFMMKAFIASLRSKDPNTQHGACIVDKYNHEVGTGYNGFPNGCCDDVFPWTKIGKFEETKYAYVVHAEANAIMNRKNNDLNDCRLYLYSHKGYYPCNECAKLIIQSGIKEVIMVFSIKNDTEDYSWFPTKKMFQSANVKTRTLGKPFVEELNFVSEEIKFHLNFLKKELGD